MSYSYLDIEKIEVTPELIERFLDKIQPTIEGHFIWTGVTSRNHKGYGSFVYKKVVYRAHRIAYYLANGSIRKDLEIDHLCGVTSCVNPTHLELVTKAENLKRQHAKRRLMKEIALAEKTLQEVVV